MVHKYLMGGRRITWLVIALVFLVVQFAPLTLLTKNVKAALAATSSSSSTGFVITGTYSEVGGQPTGVGLLKNGNVGAYVEGAVYLPYLKLKTQAMPLVIF